MQRATAGKKARILSKKKTLRRLIKAGKLIRLSNEYNTVIINLPEV